LEYFFNEQQVMVRDLARRIAEEKILPVRAELDEKEEFPWSIIKDLASSDMFRIFIPPEYDGLGGGCLDFCLIVEELSRACSGVAISYAASALGSYAIVEYGSEAQKQKYLPDIAAGTKLGAFALTEPTAGSDASAIKTTAEKTPEGYLLNGTKQYITNGGEADIYTVIALTNKTKGPRGASAFIVEKDTPGFTFGKKEKKLGIRSSATRALSIKREGDLSCPCGYLTGHDRVSGRRLSALPREHWKQLLSTPASAYSSDSPLSHCRLFRVCWQIWLPESRLPETWYMQWHVPLTVVPKISPRNPRWPRYLHRTRP